MTNRGKIVVAAGICAVLAGCGVPPASFAGTGQAQYVNTQIQPGTYATESRDPGCDWRVEDHQGRYRWPEAEPWELTVQRTDRAVVVDPECGLWLKQEGVE